MAEQHSFEDRTGKVAVVIGGTGGLGRVVCELLAREGADIAFTYRSNAEAAAGLASGIEAQGRRCLAARVAIEQQSETEAFIADVIDRFGRLDSLVYASGPTIALTTVARVETEEWRRVMDNDINGCFNVVHAALPHLRATQGSFTAIVTAGVDRPPALDVLSTAPKAAIQAIVRTLAMEEGRNGVRANCLAPGFINVGLGQKLIDSMKPEQGEAAIRRTPLRRMGTPQEIADGVAFLSSARASFITGITLFVSGGMEL